MRKRDATSIEIIKANSSMMIEMSLLLSVSLTLDPLPSERERAIPFQSDQKLDK